MKIIGLNGIYTKPNEMSGPDLLLEALRKRYHLPVMDLNYPLTTVLDGYNKENRMAHAGALKEVSSESDIVFGHSRGAVVIHTATTLGAKFKYIILFGAALENYYSWPEGCAKKIYNVHNRKDYLLMLGSLLPFHVFGNLGRTGYKGPENETILNLDARKFHRHQSFLNVHSDYFVEPNLEFWAGFLNQLARYG